MINWEGSGRKLSMSYLGTTPACAGETGEDKETVNRTFDVLLASKTEDLPNTSEALKLQPTFSVWRRNSHDE